MLLSLCLTSALSLSCRQFDIYWKHSNLESFRMIEVEIIEHKKIGIGVFEIRFPKIFSFKAGQVVNLYVHNHAPRIYSIASGESDDYIAILFDVKPEGKVTPILEKMGIGMYVHISEPFGNFTCTNEKAFWIASGTGIAPFYSMFRTGLSTNKTLIHGSRKRVYFYYQDDFIPALGRNYVRCCSRETSVGLYAGRLTDYLMEQEFLPPDQKYYLCGNAEMVVEVRDLLISRNIPFSSIKAEIYF